MYESFMQRVREIARAELLQSFNSIKEEIKADGSVVTAVDLRLQEALIKLIKEYFPDTAVLGEEMPEAQQQQLMEAASVWCVDPLDGTSNFAAGIPFFSVSLCLINNKILEFGLVYDPVRDEMFSAEAGKGARLNGEVLTNSGEAKPIQHAIALIDFKRLPPELAARLVTDPQYRSQRSFGSVALDWCWIAAGRGDCYVHGKQKIWDYGAGHLLLQEVQGRCCTLEGGPVFDGGLGHKSAVLALNADIFEQWKKYLLEKS